MVPLSFCGIEFMALPEGALYWPKQRTLLVADLHLEKASWYARFGQFLPPQDSEATLSTLETAIWATRVERVICLGDSFHDSRGVERMSDTAVAKLNVLCNQFEWLWITGNHDDDLGSMPWGKAVPELLLDGLCLRHEASPDDERPEISGHFHPKFRMRIRGHQVSRRCFFASSRKIILPAFGALTGGLDVTHKAFKTIMGGAADALLPVEGRLLRFPVR